MSHPASSAALDLTNTEYLNDADLVEPVRIHNGQRRRLRLLSYNIQAGIASSGYHHYLTHSWKHILPYPQRMDNLDRIAGLISEFDIVGLQEVDSGSLRSGFVNQTEYLALQAQFPYWYDQTNRNLGKLAQHSTGFLSRYRPMDVSEIKLPGVIPGRGVMAARFGSGPDSLLLLILHLALGRRARRRQIDFVSELMQGYRHVILMGDMNCCSESMEINALLKNAQLCEPTHGLHTYPSWCPQRNIDHILVSSSLHVENVSVINYPLSDHLPIAMDVNLPEDIRL